ncbi:nucleolar complex protein 3 homolog isoform X3 [Agrilus planipennis]|uniref:NOC3-like protein n=1 Tax=Agrilus planipennis TaxID=224129 RepID=A0A7F5RFD7_AGRPL|nr:nucleolar complex protein 3 homolog isoform X3 [Agrilus planipennis]
MTTTKISKEKRKNQKRNKALKQGTAKKKQKHTNKHVTNGFKPPKTVYSDEEESEGEDDMLDMVEKEDISFLKSAIANRSYNLLSGIKFQGSTSKKGTKRKHGDEDTEALEEHYENQTKVENNVNIKNLLPIKAHGKIIPQVRVEAIEVVLEDKEKTDSEEDTQSDNEGSFILEEDVVKPITTVDLLASHAESLNKKKIQIGSLCAGILENPEEKLDNLRVVLKILDENLDEAFLTVRKIVIVALQEVFKDILPEFKIKLQENTGVKLKKETFKLQKYENTLLLCYKRFLKKLEKYMGKLIRKKGNTQKPTLEQEKLGEQSLQTMCDLLVSHPYFNFSENIAQAVIPFLCNKNKSIRLIVSSAFKNVFKEDKRGEITLKIVRLLNQLLKRHTHNVNTEMLEIFLSLKIKEVNLDQEKEHELKQKKLLSHKKRVLQLSKKEKKKKKQLQELEKELLETKAEENKKAKQQNLTEITKVVFGVCFRILKTSKNTKMLGIALGILSKFAHCINIDFYVDLVNTLKNLMQEDWLSYHERLHCMKTVFSILSGHGEALNIDPSFLYVNLYKDLLTIHASKSHNDLELALETLTQALVKRRKKVTNKRIIGFTKRLSILALQLLHNGSLGCLGIIRTLLQQNQFIDVLLDLDPSLGDGNYQPEIEDPEYCNASTTAMYETVLLSKHYHPIVRNYSTLVAHGVHVTGDKSIPIDVSKLTPEELCRDFDMAEMAFNPPVPAPKPITKVKMVGRHCFVNSDFHRFCLEKSKFKRDCKGIFL